MKNTKNWTGNKKSTYVTLGASNHTEKERQKDDYYYQSYWCYSHVVFHFTVLETASPKGGVYLSGYPGHLLSDLPVLGH